MLCCFAASLAELETAGFKQVFTKSLKSGTHKNGDFISLFSDSIGRLSCKFGHKMSEG